MAAVAATLIAEQLTLAAYLGIGTGKLYVGDFGRNLKWIALHEFLPWSFGPPSRRCARCNELDDHWLHGPWMLDDVIGIKAFPPCDDQVRVF